jgi:hypothetical protein
MARLSFFILMMVCNLSANLMAAPVCQRCEEIREYRKQHPEKQYEFYEDYLEARKAAERNDNQSVTANSKKNG